MCFSNFNRAVVTSALATGVVFTGVISPQQSTAQPPLPITPLPALTSPPALSPQAPEVVASAVKQAVSREFNVPLQRLRLVSTTKQQWPDGCLGLAKPEEFCTQAIVPGYRIEITDGVQIWFYRTDSRGQIVRLEGAGKPRLPVTVANRLVRRVARDTGVPVQTLKITEVKPGRFGGCLGVYRPRQVCTKILIQGWQAIVQGPRRTWVYHLDQSGSKIRRNPTASGAKPRVRTSFELFGALIGEIDRNVVFQRTISGGLLGEVNTITLTEDGKLSSLRSSPLIRTRPVLLKTLTANQVDRFKRFLDNRRFPNLNGLSYLTEAALADYPTTMLRTPGHAVQYIDLEKPNLPRSLRRVVRRWERLIRTDLTPPATTR